MRFWAGLLGLFVASGEIFIACSNDTTTPNDAAMMDMSLVTPDAPSSDGGGDATSDAKDGASADAMDGGTGCDASLQTDPRNCGRCGHDCIAGNCLAGECLPWTILATPASDITSDNQSVYWVSGSSPGDVSTCPRTGCDAGTPLVSNTPQPGKVAVDNANVYFTTYIQNGGYLGACAKGGCDGGATVLSGNHTYPSWLVVDPNAVYYNVYNADIFKCTLPSCPDGGVSVTTTSVAQGLAEDQTNLFWTEGYASIYSCQKSSCNALRKLIASNLTGLGGVAAFNNNVYALQSGASGKVLRCPNAVNCNPTTLAQNLDDANDIEVDATGIYFTQHGSNPATNGALLYCPVNGCMGSPKTLIGNLSYVNAVGIDQDAVYVVSSGSAIQAIAKP